MIMKEKCYSCRNEFEYELKFKQHGSVYIDEHPIYCNGCLKK